MTGESAIGEWKLLVQDLAKYDRGRLTSWSVDLKGHKDTTVLVEESPGLIIPDDNRDGIERTLMVSTTGTLDDILVELDISHTYISDLIVQLTAPDNTSVLLHNRIGGSSDNIIKEYSLINTSALQILRGVSINGLWTLNVSDHAGMDQGKLNHWALLITPG